ncbi:MAG: iron ABC transporter permease [Deltaproteobacteria bacterium]|nr:iron ABC transporter permease [Deltaproteobacteria bacterium]
MRLGTAAYVGLMAAGAGALLLAAVFALGVGAAELPAGRVLDALLGGADAVARPIVVELRLPRVLGAALVGGALAVTGAVLQAVLRNPLADPYVLGISSGASVGAALAALWAGAAVGLLLRSGLAFAAALISVGVVYRVAQVQGRLPPVRLILAGVALSAFATALTGFLLFMVPEATAVRGVVFWLMGGLAGVRWDGLAWTAAWVLPFVAVMIGTARWQNLLLLGDEAALALGLDVARARRALVLLAALTAGALVAFAGAIGFVGLVVPHALRPFTGPEHRRLLPATLVFGALLLVVMDTGARTLMAPEELPVGILTGLLGGPFFLVLLRGQRWG